MVVWRRRPALPAAALWLAGAGLALIILAAGRPTWQAPARGRVCVMVDVSPSTRGADYRKREHLDRRIRSLLGKTPYEVRLFADERPAKPPPASPTADPPEIATEQTVYNPPTDCAAVVLFSDGQFEPPTSGPTAYVVVDPLLESPADASVTALRVTEAEATASVGNSAAPRPVILDGAARPTTTLIPTGGLTVSAPMRAGAAARITARLSAGDAWPENDQLTSIAPPPEQREQWWVGASAPDARWRALSPGQLPADSGGWLSPGVVVLDNIAAADLAPAQLRGLDQYVKDLGGSLVILGGDRAFAAGGYPGAILESLSPLASTPPQPSMRWILLADASGSMNQISGGASLWRQAGEAINQLIPRLPPGDLVSTGSFAERLTWWTVGRTAADTAALPLPPPDLAPHGPTNLEDSLSEMAQSQSGDEPRALLLLTDADAQINDPPKLEAAFRTAHISLHLLAIGNGSALPILRSIARNTGGSVVKELDPRAWAAAAQKLMRSAAPRLLGDGPLSVRFVGPLASLAPVRVTPWNRTWIKQNATPTAIGDASPAPAPAGAMWNVGEGRVLALAFDPGPAAAQLIAAAVAGAPRDPRFRINVDAGRRLKVSVDAGDAREYLNTQAIQLDLSDEADGRVTLRQKFEQSGPGRYEIDLPAPRRSMLGAVRMDGRAAERFAVAGRYAAEFDAIGNNHASMNLLARRTGGQIVPPRQTWPIDFRWPTRAKDATAWFAALGAAFLSVALLLWRRTV